MNKFIGANQTTLLVHDERWVADAVLRQLEAIAPDKKRPAAVTFLNCPFALGYAFGFVDRGGWFAANEGREKLCPEYLRNVVSNLLGDAALADSFIAYAATKRGDRLYERGFDVGQEDMDAACLSSGEKNPSGLVNHLKSG